MDFLHCRRLSLLDSVKGIFYHGESLFYYAHGEDRLGKLMDG
jgi:hypothetical protein